MSHFKVDKKAFGAILTEYPHDPEDRAGSVADYLEANFSDGWVFHSLIDYSGEWYLVFTANGQP